MPNPESNQPSDAWKKEVAKLDSVLYQRGKPLTMGFVGKVASWRAITWSADEADYMYTAARMWGIPLGSDMTQMSELPVGDIRSLNLGSTALVRRVEYVPRGVFAWHDHGVSDETFTFDDYHRLREGDVTFEEAKRLKSAVALDRSRQRQTGFSQPTLDSYEFLLESLRVGVSATS